VDGEPEFCMHGFGGAGGPGGSRHAVGGKPGTVQGGAAMGTPGAPPPPIGANGTCDNGEDGLPGVQMCPTGGSCCLPGDGPGCADGRCAALVCEIDHFCCEVLWDQICADLANQLCPSCGGGASNCCSANGGIGCDDSRCQNIVCSLNPLCCQVAWDQICADLAQQLCPICGSQ
jgi:hypothetical protein